MQDYGEEIRSRLPNHSVAVASTPQEERECIASARVATGITITEDLIGRAKNLELFVVASSGCNHLPMEVLDDRDVTAVNASGIHAPGIAEQVVGYILVFARRLYEGWHRQQQCEWRHYQASELKDDTVTVVGLGSIGETIVERLAGFEVKTIGVRYTPEKGGPTDEVIGFDYDDFHEALARTSYLVLASPLTDTTRGLVDAEALATLPPDAAVVNIARGGLVDTDALTRALQIGDIRHAALDVTDPEPLPTTHPLWAMRNVTITPHMGGHTPKHWPRLADILAENVQALDTDEHPKSFENHVSTV
jgi:phosphoglycerate dehydrogenase-like enzyme